MVISVSLRAPFGMRQIFGRVNSLQERRQRKTKDRAAHAEYSQRRDELVRQAVWQC
jgi:hypothetical protein